MYEEYKKVLDSFQNDKSPGVDGLFYCGILQILLWFTRKWPFGVLKWGVWKTRTYHLATKRHKYFTTKRKWLVTRFTLSTGDLSNKQQIPGILVALDFRKTFDSLEWPFIMETLNSFNFTTSIKQWISTFSTNIESRVINNGYSTNWFQLSKGIRQGCPFSLHLFVLICASTVKNFNLYFK